MNEFAKRIVVPKNVTEVLKEVIYPGNDKDIVSLGMVQEIRIAGKKISFSLVFPAPGDPYISAVTGACEKAIEEGLGTGFDLKGNIAVKYSGDMEPALLQGVKNIVAISSGKGGVGKSTVAVNLAVALANRGSSVGLIDADIFGPSIPKMFGTEGVQPEVRQVNQRTLIVPVERFGVKFLSIGFFVAPENPLVWRGPMASNALKQLISDGDWGALDYLLIDLPPGTSDIHLTLVQTIPVTGAIIVTTPQEVALADVVKGVNMFRSEAIHVPVLGLVENMSWFTPEELPENKYYIFGREGGKNLALASGLALLGQIPLVQSICEGSDKGIPSASVPDSVMGAAFAQLAGNVVEQLNLRHSNLEPTEKVNITRK